MLPGQGHLAYCSIESVHSHHSFVLGEIQEIKARNKVNKHQSSEECEISAGFSFCTIDFVLYVLYFFHIPFG